MRTLLCGEMILISVKLPHFIQRNKKATAEGRLDLLLGIECFDAGVAGCKIGL